MEYINTAKFVSLVTLGTFITTQEYSAFFGGLVALLILLVFYSFKEKSILEGFEIKQLTKLNKQQLGEVIKKDYIKPSANNPLGNVLLTEIEDDPLRKSAPPSFADDHINTQTKKMVQNLNKGINTNKDLFGDENERFEFDKSLRQFYSTANTRILNNQNTFAQWLYGNMPSAKEGDKFALIRDNPRYNLH